MDSSEASFPMQPIYVFHNMNTMQQRLGIPYYSTGPSSKGKDGKESGSGSNILRNYYLVHGQVKSGGEESNGENNISPIPVQTPRDFFDAHHTMNSIGGSTAGNHHNTLGSASTVHNISSGNINIAAAREKLLLKYNLFAHNIASAGESHLSLLYETCLVQFEDISITIADFVPNTSAVDALSTAVEGISINPNNPNAAAHNASNEHMKAIFTRMGMSTSSMSLLEDYASIRIENSLSYNSSSSDDATNALTRSNSSRDFSEDEQEDAAGDGLMINISPFDYDKGSAMVVVMRYLDIVSAYSEVLQLQVNELIFFNYESRDILICFSLSFAITVYSPKKKKHWYCCCIVLRKSCPLSIITFLVHLFLLVVLVAPIVCLCKCIMKLTSLQAVPVA